MDFDKLIDVKASLRRVVKNFDFMGNYAIM